MLIPKLATTGFEDFGNMQNRRSKRTYASEITRLHNLHSGLKNNAIIYANTGVCHALQVNEFYPRLPGNFQSSLPAKETERTSKKKNKQTSKTKQKQNLICSSALFTLSGCVKVFQYQIWDYYLQEMEKAPRKQIFYLWSFMQLHTHFMIRFTSR